ncbi:baseplate hub assembly catalyst [Phage C48C1]|nr:baseplate hub assembly catalyst [Phage C48C1]
MTEVEDMLPWEREIYLTMLIDDIKEKNERAKQQG